MQRAVEGEDGGPRGVSSPWFYLYLGLGACLPVTSL